MQHDSARQSGMRKCPDDFLCCKRSFLLIARTDRIVTAALLDGEYRRILGCSSI